MSDETLFTTALGCAVLGMFAYYFFAKEVVPFVKKADTIIPNHIHSWDVFLNKEVPMLCGFVKKVCCKLHEAKYFMPQIKEYFSSFFW